MTVVNNCYSHWPVVFFYDFTVSDYRLQCASFSRISIYREIDENFWLKFSEEGSSTFGLLIISHHSFPMVTLMGKTMKNLEEKKIEQTTRVA
jgi:hypothetical protein